MKELRLPRFKLLPLPRRRMSLSAYDAWVSENRRRLAAAGRLKAILADPSRRPTDARFTFKDNPA